MTKRALGECPVCCENFTKSSRKPIVCAECNYEVCQVCAQKYLTSTVENTNCMQCHHEWDLEFLHQNFSRTWMEGSFKKHRQDVLFETEKARLPDSQHLVRNYKAAERLKNEIKEQTELIKLIDAQKRDLELIRWRMRRDVNALEENNYNTMHVELDEDEGGEGTSSLAPSFIRRCPRLGEDCRGFLDASYKCGICNMFACSKCMVLLGESGTQPDHVCNAGLVETVELLKKDTRSCPKCNVSIHKSEGCDQMWCTMCHTAFSYNTGKIVARGEALHNPHWVAWDRQNGQRLEEEEGMADRNRLPSIWQFDRETYLFRRGLSLHATKNKDSLSRHLRILTHVERVVLGEELILPPPAEEANVDLRRKYLMNEIDEGNWKRQLFAREKKREKNQAFRDVYTKLVELSAPIFWHPVDDEEDLFIMLKELKDVAEFMNDAISKVTDRFKCTAPYKLEVPIVFSEETKKLATRIKLRV